MATKPSTELASATTPTALDPARLDEAAQQAARELIAEGESRNTRVSYDAGLRYWHRWYALRFGHALNLPVAPATVVHFVLDHALRRNEDDALVHELPPEVDAALVQSGAKAAKGPLSMATIVHRVSVMSKLHEISRLPNPCKDPGVREVLAKARRAHAKRGELSRGKDALTREPMEAILATCNESVIGKRDRALLLFAFSSGGRRRSEVVAATMETVRANLDGTYTFELRHSKTNQAGNRGTDDFKPVSGRAAQALAAWLEVAKITEGPIFRHVRRGGAVAGPLTARAVRSIVIKRCALAGLPKRFSAHSLRSGFITEAGRQNIPTADVMALSGHRDPATVARYQRAGALHTHMAATLLDTQSEQ